MIRALCWKEYRVHRMAWLLVAAFAAAAIGCEAAAIPRAGWPFGYRPGAIAKTAAGFAIIATTLYGLICGAMLLAGEREARVMDYLDRLTLGRAPLWATKTILGVVFTFSQGLVLGSLAVLVGWLEGLQAPTSLLALLPLFALDGLAWGLAASAWLGATDAAAMLGLVLLLIAWVVALGLGLLIDVHFIAVRVVLGGAAAIFSCLVFCRPDVSRDTSVAGLMLRGAARSGWFEAAAVVVFALLLPRSEPALWPLGVLLIGVVFGVLAFAGEEKDGKYRFLGEHWLPLHKVWLLKTAGLLLGAVVASAAVLLAALHVADRTAALQSLSETAWALRDGVRFASLLPDFGPWSLMALVLATAFSAGQFGGLLLRRRYLAIPVGLLVSAALLLLWLPSLVLGGQALWPLLLPPMLLLAAVGFVVWGKANGHAHTRRHVLCCGLLAALWMGGILWYRVAEIPDVEPFDRQAFEAALSPQDNDSGVLLREVCEELESKRLPDDWALWMMLIRPEERFLENRWATATDDERADHLHSLFASELPGRVRKAVAMRMGSLHDPRAINRSREPSELHVFQKLGSLFLCRASQLQARGGEAESLDHLAVVLALSRQLRQKTPLRYLEVGERLEWQALSAFELWLKKVGASPDMLRQAAEALQRHEEMLPQLSDNVRAEYYGFSDAVAEFIGVNKAQHAWLYPLARALPWETAREERQINVLFAERLALLERPYWKAFPPPRAESSAQGVDEYEERRRLLPPTLQPTVWWPLACESVARRELADTRAYHLTLLRGARLQTALARYSVENAKQAATLSALIPRYLPELPPDPFSGRPFCYRISSGDRFFRERFGGQYIMSWTQTIPAGQGLVWSVGPDQVDHGGKKQGRDNWIGNTRIWATGGLDLIFVVPYLSKN